MNSSTILDLPDVTICAVDTVNPALAARALDISMSQCRFGDAVLFTHEEVATRARIAKIDSFRSLTAYSAFMLKELASRISTPWVLVVQWDGYVVDASQWSDSFREYDYVGARWVNAKPGFEVGNGGFSLRSRKLLEALADDRFTLPANAIEDELICGTWRSALENEHGIRFAPGEIADHFSYEYQLPHLPTFGFHGVFNMWRHIEDEEMMKIIQTLDIRTLGSARGVALLRNYCEFRKFACVKSIYGRYRELWSSEDVANGFLRNGLDHDSVRRCIAICEAA